MKIILSTSLVLITFATGSARDCLAQHSFADAQEGRIPADTLAEMGLDGLWQISDEEASLVRGSPWPPYHRRWLVGLYNRFLWYPYVNRSRPIVRSALVAPASNHNDAVRF
jgi:hypothetical protein